MSPLLTCVVLSGLLSYVLELNAFLTMGSSASLPLNPWAFRKLPERMTRREPSPPGMASAAVLAATLTVYVSTSGTCLTPGTAPSKVSSGSCTIAVPVRTVFSAA